MFWKRVWRTYREDGLHARLDGVGGGDGARRVWQRWEEGGHVDLYLVFIQLKDVRLDAVNR